jgi:hypothetical protein
VAVGEIDLSSLNKGLLNVRRNLQHVPVSDD